MLFLLVTASTRSIHCLLTSRSFRLTLIMRRSGASRREHAASFASPNYEVIEDAKFLNNGGVARFVKPYVQSYITYAKGRWLGREVMEVLSTEFGSQPLAYWQHVIAQGHVKVNDQSVGPTYRLQNSDRLLHRTHRHEPPVFGRIRLIAETDDLVAVSKPPSLPMHTCGAYKFNTLEYILKYEPVIAQQPTLHVVHRLDRVTSGLCILAKNKEAAAKISLEIQSKTTTKIYLARVKGRFPADLSPLKQMDSLDLNALAEEEDAKAKAKVTGKRTREVLEAEEEGEALPVGYHMHIPSREEVGRSDRVGYFISSAAATAIAPCVEADSASDEIYYIQCPLSVVSQRDAIHCCDPSGKASLSIFRSLGYCPITDTSLVECRPYTGRTHQLRLHLQLCGNPIANDPCYGGQLFYGDDERRTRALNTLIDMRLAGIMPLSKTRHLIADEELERILEARKAEGRNEEDKAADMNQADGESEDDYLLRTCKFCRSRASAMSESAEHLLHCDGIWLHAFRYSGSDWAFAADVPVWAEQFLPSKDKDTTVQDVGCGKEVL